MREKVCVCVCEREIEWKIKNEGVKRERARHSKKKKLFDCFFYFN